MEDISKDWREKMKKFKKVIIMVLTITIAIGLSGCNKKTENVEGTLKDLMTNVYKEVSDDEKPMMLQNIELTEDNIENYLGTTDIEFVEGLASESEVGSIAHSVVLLKVDDNADTESIKTKIKDSVNPRKWICVEAEKVIVKSKRNLIILIMSSNDLAEKLETGFDNL